MERNRISAGGNRIPGKDKVRQVLQPSGTDCIIQGKRRHSDTGYAKAARAGGRV